MENQENKILEEIYEIVKKVNESVDKTKLFPLIKDIGVDKALRIAKVAKPIFMFLESLIKLANSLEKPFDPNIFSGMPFIQAISYFFTNMKESEATETALKEYVGSMVNMLFPSIEMSKTVIEIQDQDDLLKYISERFLKSLKAAEERSPKAVRKVFHQILDEIKDIEKPRRRFDYASYSNLGLENVENMTLDEVSYAISNKNDILSTYPEPQMKDIVFDLIVRLAKVVETFLKVMLTAITNLEKVSTNEEFSSTKNLMKYYLEYLSFPRFPKGSYLDIRNCDSHDDIKIEVIDNKRIKAIFYIRHFHKRVLVKTEDFHYFLDELNEKVQNFLSYTGFFLKVFETYLLDYELKKEGKTYEDILKEASKYLIDKNLVKECKTYWDEFGQKY